MARYLIAERWSDISDAIQEKGRNPEKFLRVYIGKIEASASTPVHTRKYAQRKTKARKKHAFFLGPPLEAVCLTRREMQVAYLICLGRTNQFVADAAGLSVRTVEYYIKNMRQKILANSKMHLVEMLLKTDFIERYDGHLQPSGALINE